MPTQSSGKLDRFSNKDKTTMLHLYGVSFSVCDSITITQVEKNSLVNLRLCEAPCLAIRILCYPKLHTSQQILRLSADYVEVWVANRYNWYSWFLKLNRYFICIATSGCSRWRKYITSEWFIHIRSEEWILLFRI